VYGDGPFRPLQGASRREEVLLAQLRGGRSLLLGETWKWVKGADSTCPRCGDEEEDLEHVLRACLELENPFVQVPRRSWLCRQIRWRWSGSPGRSSIGIIRDRLPPNNNNNNAGGELMTLRSIVRLRIVSALTTMSPLLSSEIIQIYNNIRPTSYLTYFSLV
jgi:hypothetical protein